MTKQCTRPLLWKTVSKQKYTNAAALKDASVAVEAGSAGMSAAEAAELKVVEYTYQSDALMAVESGKADACIIDVTMANAMTGEGTSYEKLTTTFSLTEEEYAIACREESDLCAKLNEIMADLIEDGTLRELAKKYEVEMPLVEAVNDILFNGRTPGDVIQELMIRDRKNENLSIDW